MTSLALYSNQPILTAGIQAATEDLEDFAPARVFSDLDPLIEHVRTCGSCVVLLDVASDVPFAVLSTLKTMVCDAPVVLWVSDAPAEFVSEALALGVRGILRKSLPIDLQIKCLRNVAAGELWVEQTLCEELLTGKRLHLTPREREMLGFLAQGLKNKEIAYAMTLGEGTVKVYLSKLFRKVGAKDRFTLALFALKNFMVDGALAPAPARAARASRMAGPSQVSFFPKLGTAAWPEPAAVPLGIN